MNNEKKYEIWLVPNGRRSDFARGITGAGYPDACQCWGMDMTLDEVRTRYRELAEENFHPEDREGEWDRICDAADTRVDGLDDDEEDRRRQLAVDAADKAMDKYLDELTADPDPLNWASIEWHNDLKWVTIRLAQECC